MDKVFLKLKFEKLSLRIDDSYYSNNESWFNDFDVSNRFIIMETGLSVFDADRSRSCKVPFPDQSQGKAKLFKLKFDDDGRFLNDGNLICYIYSKFDHSKMVISNFTNLDTELENGYKIYWYEAVIDGEWYYESGYPTGHRFVPISHF